MPVTQTIEVGGMPFEVVRELKSPQKPENPSQNRVYLASIGDSSVVAKVYAGHFWERRMRNELSALELLAGLESVPPILAHAGNVAVFKYLKGTMLEDWMREQFDEEILVVVGLNIAKCIQGIHRSEVVHGDVKPSNILVENTKIALVDYELSGPPNYPRMPAPWGTRGYMAPEVFENKSGYKADIWSLGVVLYKMLTDIKPFEGWQMTGRPASPSANPELSRLILTMLQINPEARPTIDAVVSELTALAHPAAQTPRSPSCTQDSQRS